MIIVVNLFMFTMALCDIRYKRLPLWGLLLFLFTGVIHSVFSDKLNMMLVIGGILLGGIFVFLSFVTREMIGYGDSLLLVGVGAWMGINYLLGVCYVAFALGFVIAVILMITGVNRKGTIPFVPFMLVGSLYMTYREIV